MLERHKLLMGRTQDRAGQNNGSIGVFWRSFNGIIGHIRYMFRGLKITHNHEHSSLYLFGHNYFTVYGKMVVPLCSEIFSGQTHTPIDWKFHCASFAV